MAFGAGWWWPSPPSAPSSRLLWLGDPASSRLDDMDTLTASAAPASNMVGLAGVDLALMPSLLAGVVDDSSGLTFAMAEGGGPATETRGGVEAAAG